MGHFVALLIGGPTLYRCLYAFNEFNEFKDKMIYKTILGLNLRTDVFSFAKQVTHICKCVLCVALCD